MGAPDLPRSATGRRRWLLAATVALLAIGACALFYRARFHPFLHFSPDAYDYAQMGRQVYRGEGFTSLQAFPYTLAFLAENGVETEPPWPNTTRFPLVSIAHAIAFSIVGPNSAGVVLSGGAFFVGAAILVFLLGNRLFGPGVGFVAAVVVLADARQQQLAVSGLLEPGAGFFLVLSTLLFALCARSEGRRLAPLGLGAVLGLAFLQRYDLLVLLPAAILATVVRRRQIEVPELVAIAAGFLVVTGPWFARNLWLFGSLLGSTSVHRNLMFGVSKGDFYQATRSTDTLTLLWENFPALIGKVEKAARWTWRAWPTTFGRELRWLFPAFVLAPFLCRGRETRLVWWYLTIGLVLRYLLLTIMHHESRFYASYVPAFSPFAVAALAALAAKLPGRLGEVRIRTGAAAVAVLVLLVSLPVRLSSHMVVGGGVLPMYEELREAAAGGLTSAQNSGKVAWYADVPVVRFGKTLRQLERLDAAYGPVNAVLLDRRSKAFENQMATRAVAPFRERARLGPTVLYERFGG